MKFYLEEVGEIDQLENLKKEVKPFVCYSLLIWSLWGIIQSCISGVDFDYVQYSIDRVNLYYKYKLETFGVQSLTLILK